MAGGRQFKFCTNCGLRATGAVEDMETFEIPRCQACDGSSWSSEPRAEGGRTSIARELGRVEARLAFAIRALQAITDAPMYGDDESWRDIERGDIAKRALTDLAALVPERVEALESILRELRGGYDDFYSTGDNSRLLNVEAQVRGLFPPLGDE